MRRIRAITLVAFVVAAVTVSTPASASCQTSDLKGTWFAFIADLNVGEWERCKLKMDSGGRVSGAACTLADGTRIPIVGGRLNVTSKCRLSGTLNFAGGVTAVLTQGQVSRSKGVASGVGFNNFGLLFAFTAIKR